MKPDELKELTIWMKNEGVQQFTIDGAAVVFHPKALRLSDAKREQDPPKAKLEDYATGMLQIDELIPQQ